MSFAPNVKLQHSASFVPPIVLGLLAMAMAIWTWGTWSDVIIDFGRELYLAWQVAEGARLYVDVASFNGPLSPHVNAVWFHLLGLSVRALVVGNLLILTVLLAVLYSVLRSMADRTAATIAGGTFVLLFAFGEYDDVGNFNYVTPYAHEIVHGLLASLIAIRALISFTRKPRRPAALVAGVFLGVAWLTKPEVAVAASIAVLSGFGFALRSASMAGGRWRYAAALSAGIAAPVLIAWALLARTMPAGEAAWMLIQPYRFLVNPGLSSLPFYSRMTGLDAPLVSLFALVRAALVYAALIGALIALSFLVKRLRVTAEAAVGTGIVFLLVGFFTNRAVVDGVARPLPVFMLGAAVLLVWRLLHAHDADDTRTDVARLTMVLFAGALMAKIALNAHIYRYGFVLAMPASLLVVLALTSWLPRYVESRGGDAGYFRASALVAIATVTLMFMATHKQRLEKNTYVVGAGADRIRADSRALPMSAMVRVVEERTSHTDRLVVLPEGALLNYLTRRAGSTPYAAYLPPEFVMFGADRIAAALRKNPPEYVVLVDRPMKEYGSSGFERDYGRDIASWIDANYTIEASVPGAPIVPPDFSMRLLRRSDLAAKNASR